MRARESERLSGAPPRGKCCRSRHGGANLLFSSPPFLRRVWVLSRRIIGSARFLLHSRVPLSPKYSHLFRGVYSSAAFSSTLFSHVSPSSPPPPPPPPALANVGNISSLTGPHSDTQTVVPSWSPRGPAETREERRERIQSTVSALFGLLNTDLTSVNRGTDDI